MSAYRSGFLVICFWFAAGLLLCGQEPDRTPDLPEGDLQEFYLKALSEIRLDSTDAEVHFFLASILDNSLHRSREALADYILFLEKLDRMPDRALKKNRQIPTIREIVEDRIELLREELFFRDGFD